MFTHDICIKASWQGKGLYGAVQQVCNLIAAKFGVDVYYLIAINDYTCNIYKKYGWQLCKELQHLVSKEYGANATLMIWKTKLVAKI